MNEKLKIQFFGIVAYFLKPLIWFAILTAWILTVVWRFEHVGRVCSGDFREDFPGKYEDLYLIERGNLFKGLSWFSFILIGLVFMTAVIVGIADLIPTKHRNHI